MGNQIARTILDSLSAHVAILDEQGRILETNLAWKRFAEENQIQMRPDTINVNYLEVCDRASGFSGEESARVADEIRKVIEGKITEFVLDYPCHSPDEQRWFYMRVTRASGPGPLRIVVSHENITALKLAQQQVQQSESALFLEKQKLEEANTALKVLLRQREVDQRELEMGMLENSTLLIVPILERLQSLSLSQEAHSLLASLQCRIDTITKPFVRRLSALEVLLTPQELEVAALIREGRSSKEIAAHLNLSLTTIHFHRRNLRKKLRVHNTRTNLRTFLLALTD